MHPDIKKFWENSKYEIFYDLIGSGEEDIWYQAIKKSKEGYTIESFWILNIDKRLFGRTRYWFAGYPSKSFSEEEALRYIRLKAFM